MKTNTLGRTDELAVATPIKSGQYIIADINSSSNNSYNYIANQPDGTRIALKEFYLRDMCSRDGNMVSVPDRANAKTFRSLIKGFSRDAAFLTSLDSDHVSNVRDIFEENGTAYMVSDIPKGEPLSDMLVNTSVTFTPSEIESITNDLARALVEIHGFGMLHRDISPSNITLTPDRRAILLPDFGTFREDRSSASRVVSSVLQSAQNYAPFELTFDDARQGDGSDVYCVAAVVYHLITGKPPVASLDRIAAVAGGLPDPYQPLLGNHKGYSDQFLTAIDMSLELFFDKRVHSATELIHITSNSLDFQETQSMRSDAKQRSALLQKTGVFARMRNLLTRR